MKRPTITALVAMLAALLLAPAAHGATQVRQVQSEMRITVPGPPGSTVPGGAMTLEFVFKNKRGSKKQFTPRQLTNVSLESVPLMCVNDPLNPTGTSEFLLSTSLETAVKFQKPPQPKPKPGRYAFKFAFSFPAFDGTLRGTVKKVTGAPPPRIPRAQGGLVINDLDAGPTQWNCNSSGTRNWSGTPVTIG